MKTPLVQSITTKCVQKRLPVLLVGAPGVGKTDIINQVARNLDYDLLVSHPVVEDPTDAKGLPFPAADGLSASFLPYGQLARAIKVTRPTIWFLDDLGQANPSMQAAYMQLLLARRIGEHVLPDEITFVAATNRKGDRAGVSGILEPVKSRFAAILPVEPDLESWTDWALDNRIPPELVAFLRFRPDLLCAQATSQEIANSASPRTWTNAGRLLDIGLSPEEEMPALAGAVGDAAATELTGFLRVWRELPSLDSVLLDPERAPIPGSVSALHALCSALATSANPQNFIRIARYAERVQQSGREELAAYLVKYSVRRNPACAQCAAYVSIITGPLGELFK